MCRFIKYFLLRREIVDTDPASPSSSPTEGAGHGGGHRVARHALPTLRPNRDLARLETVNVAQVNKSVIT